MREMTTGRVLSLAALAALLLAPQAAFGWGDNGHRIVGQGGEDVLSQKARDAVRQIAGQRGLAMIAAWPDFARSDKAWGFVNTWHYVTVEDGQTLAEVLERSALTLEPDNVVEAIEYFKAILAGDQERRESFQKLMDDNRATPLGGSLLTVDQLLLA